MMTVYLLLTLIGLLFAGPFCVWVITDARARHNADEAYAAGYQARARDLAEFEQAAAAHLARQSAELQRQVTR